MVMELCQAGSLTDVLKNPNLNINWRMFFRFALQTSAGVAALHAQDPPIIHRDVKSANFLVTADLRGVKVCDFGLARFNIAKNMETMNKVVGTVTYLPPEIYMGKTFTAKADVYSLSIVLWEVLYRSVTGTYAAPYVNDDFNFDWQILLAVSQNNRRPKLPKGTPKQLKKLLAKAWAAEPDDRPTAAELVKELKGLQKLPEFNDEGVLLKLSSTTPREKRQDISKIKREHERASPHSLAVEDRINENCESTEETASESEGSGGTGETSETNETSGTNETSKELSHEAQTSEGEDAKEPTSSRSRESHGRRDSKDKDRRKRRSEGRKLSKRSLDSGKKSDKKHKKSSGSSSSSEKKHRTKDEKTLHSHTRRRKSTPNMTGQDSDEKKELRRHDSESLAGRGRRDRRASEQVATPDSSNSSLLSIPEESRSEGSSVTLATR
jgi:serine/threonine protein kinase